MTTNETLAQYSDWAFKSAFTVLVLAFVLLIVQYASARAKAVQDKELVSAGGVDASVPGRVAETRASRSRNDSAEWAELSWSSERC